jgi:hypothetical protein
LIRKVFSATLQVQLQVVSHSSFIIVHLYLEEVDSILRRVSFRRWMAGENRPTARLIDVSESVPLRIKKDRNPNFKDHQHRRHQHHPHQGCIRVDQPSSDPHQRHILPVHPSSHLTCLVVNPCCNQQSTKLANIMSKAYGTVPLIEGAEIGTLLPGLRYKRGHSCCGGCCDMRRAVIIVDIIMICSLLSDIFALAAITHVPLDDDQVQQELSRVPFGVMMFLFVGELVLFGVAIWGAVTFAAPKVLVGTIVCVFGMVFSLSPFNLALLLINGFFAYPHAVLYNEISSGIMSKENYYNEEQSCCCVYD